MMDEHELGRGISISNASRILGLRRHVNQNGAHWVAIKYDRDEHIYVMLDSLGGIRTNIHTHAWQSVGKIKDRARFTLQYALFKRNDDADRRMKEATQTRKRPSKTVETERNTVRMNRLSRR
uniref:Uncharacterized protein n=1 Tax=Chaetoceros debilis TaxID=122233 RepID=A0A6S8Z1F3_9STRA